MELPPTLVEALRRRGLDVGYVVDILAKSLGVDPPSLARAHAELAVRAFREGLALAERGTWFRPAKSCTKPWRRR